MTETQASAAEATLPPATEPLLLADATELARLLREREVSAVDLLEVVLARADQVAATVNPFAIRLDDRARAAAAESDRRIADGTARPLEGVPMTTKDSQWMAGIPTFSGTLGEPYVPTETVGAVRRVEDAGAVVFAKTTTSEYCYQGISWAPGFGHTRNPHALDRTAGGSSGGAAAAVAAGAGPVGLGGDGGGSIRIPAAFCGVVGLKPTFGVVSHEPSGPGWKTLIAVGPLTRSVRDAQLLLSVLAEPDANDRHSVDALPAAPSSRPDALSAARPARVTYSEDLGFAAVDDAVRSAYRRALDGLDRAGVELMPLPADAGFTSSVRTWATIASAEARWAQDQLLASHPDAVSEAVRGYLEFGESFTAEDYVAAQFEREEVYRRYVRLFETTDAIFTPTLGGTAFDGTRAYPAAIGGHEVTEPWRDWAPLLYDANLAGLPAVSVPIGLDSAGLPIGGQLIGPRRGDHHLLALAARLEAAVA